MTTYVDVSADDWDLFRYPWTEPVTIACDSWEHLPSISDGHAPFSVTLQCQRHYPGGSEAIHVYTGICPVCNTGYIYSPNATPRHLAVIKRALEGTAPQPVPNTVTVTVPNTLLTYVDQQEGKTREEKILEIIEVAMFRERTIKAIAASTKVTTTKLPDGTFSHLFSFDSSREKKP